MFKFEIVILVVVYMIALRDIQLQIASGSRGSTIVIVGGGHGGGGYGGWGKGCGGGPTIVIDDNKRKKGNIVIVNGQGCHHGHHHFVPILFGGKGHGKGGGGFGKGLWDFGGIFAAGSQPMPYYAISDDEDDGLWSSDYM